MSSNTVSRPSLSFDTRQEQQPSPTPSRFAGWDFLQILPGAFPVQASKSAKQSSGEALGWERVCTGGEAEHPRVCVNTGWDMQGAATRAAPGTARLAGDSPCSPLQAQTLLSDQQERSGLLLLPPHSQAVPRDMPCAHGLHASLLESVPSHHCLSHGQMQPHWAWGIRKAVGAPSIQHISTLQGVLHVHSSNLLQFQQNWTPRSTKLLHT